MSTKLLGRVSMLTIDDESGHMSSDATQHGAVSAGDGTDRWTVTWLPRQALQAIEKAGRALRG